MSAPLTDNQRSMLKLIQRSRDTGDGWRDVDGAIWPLVLESLHPELTEIDEELQRVRLTPEGAIVVRYLA